MYRAICVFTTVFALAAGAAASAQRAGISQTGGSARVNATTRGLVPGTNERAFGKIQGNVLDAAGRALPNVRVRLRDCRSGLVAAVTMSDRLGLFAFSSVDPGIYVVEMLNERADMLAASELLTVNAGDTATTLVKLPIDSTPFARLLGRSVGEAAGILAAAASTGVLASSVTGDDISPR